MSGLDGWKRRRWIMYTVELCIFGLKSFYQLIQLFMGLLYFDDFVADNGMHASSPHCSNAGGHRH